MATTPLKTASRALSIATVIVMGFAAWLLGTQGAVPRENAETASDAGRKVEFSGVSATTSASNSHDVAVQQPSRRRLDKSIARPPSKPRMDVDSFCDDETRELPRVADSAKNQRFNPPRSATRIQPKRGRLSGPDREAIKPGEVDKLNLAAEDSLTQPRATRVPGRPPLASRSAEILQNSESARFESHLMAMQKKIDQLAQAQTEQKSNEVQKALETLRQIQENKQSEQIDKLLQQLKDAQQNAADLAKVAGPKADTPKSKAPVESPDDDKQADVKKSGVMRFVPGQGHQDRFDGTTNDADSSQSRTTEVTPNVIIRDGATIVVGGLIEEQANQTQSQFSGLGKLLVVGDLFKNKASDTNRADLIVLIAPRIILDPEAECEGDLSCTASERRHEEYCDKLSPIDRHNLALIEYGRAARYFQEGDAPRAKHHIDESLRHNRLDNDSLRLRDQITAAINDKNWFKKLRRNSPTSNHRMPYSPNSPPGDATFELEIPVPVPSPVTPVLRAPAKAG